MTKVLVVVAHPDDETIWCGGTLLRNKRWKTTIISLCRKLDEDRAPRFFKACEFFGAECRISDLEDENAEAPLKELEEAKQRILSMLKEREFDFIFTHGSNGEYEHNRHKEVHRAVKELLKEKSLKCKKIFFFDYTGSKEDCKANIQADKVVRLDEQELQKKKFLINKIYNFAAGGFEDRSSSNIEAFKVSDGK